MYKRKKLFILILLPFCVSLKKILTKKTTTFDCFLFPLFFLLGVSSSEYRLVFINADHLSAVGKWTTEESVEE